MLGLGLRHGIVKNECETRNEELLPGHFSTHHLNNPPSHGISACARACTCPLAQASSMANAKPFAMATDEHERRSSALTSQAHHSTWNTGLTRHRQPSLMRRARTSSSERWVAEADHVASLTSGELIDLDTRSATSTQFVCYVHLGSALSS